MTHTAQQRPKSTDRRPVAGYILASIVVGVLGLVTAILVTVSGIMNPFATVSESYDDIWEVGIEVGPSPTPLELEPVQYTLVTFSAAPIRPTTAGGPDHCLITDPNGEPARTDIATQRLSAEGRQRATRDLRAVNYANYMHFEARRGAYIISCESFGLLSDGTSSRMGGTEIRGVLIGLLSVFIAGGLFVMGVVNSSRNKKAQARNLRA